MFDGEQTTAPFFGLVDHGFERTIDFTIAALLLVFAGPLIAVLAVAIRHDKPRPRVRLVGR